MSQAIQTNTGLAANPVTWDKNGVVEIVSPVPESCYPVIWRLFNEFPGQMIDIYTPGSLEALKAQSAKSLEAGGLEFAVVKNGMVMGGVWVDATADGMCLGHLIFERDAISGAEKMKATREAVKRVFEAGFRKIIWVFFADNRAFRVFLKRLGAEKEGTLRKHLNRNGEWVDADLMASFPGTAGPGDGGVNRPSEETV